MPYKVNIAIYVLENDPVFLKIMEEILQDNKFVNYKLFNTIEGFVAALTSNFHVCIMDLYLNGGKTVFDVLKQIREKHIYCYSIVMSAYPEVDVVIDLFDKGVSKFIRKDKPDFSEKIAVTVTNAIEFINENLKFFKEVSDNYYNTKEIIQELKK